MSRAVLREIATVVSGGQTGVDRAALDWALERGIPIDGWCPAGRKAEDGPLPARYTLRETPSSGYAQRTTWNIRDSDGTLILVRGALEGGTALTARTANKRMRPLLIVRLEDQAVDNVARISAWVATYGVDRLNVAGPRESGRPGIYSDARRLLEKLRWRGRGQQ